jgi:carbonic anhydrase
MAANTCESLVIHCSDWRLEQGLGTWLKQAGLEQASFDRLAINGGIKQLVSPDSSGERDSFLKQIEASLTQHQPNNVIIVSHEDCGAYGGGGRFLNAATEQKFHASELARAAELLRAHHPGLAVALYYANLEEDDDEWKVDVQSIG